MLKIRLFRTGKKNQPFFKIVVTEKNNPPKAGRFVEEVGFYNPLTKEKNLKSDRIKYWISVGAKPSETIFNMLVSEKIIEKKKIAVHKKSKKVVKEEKGEEGKPSSSPSEGEEDKSSLPPSEKKEVKEEITEKPATEDIKKEESIEKQEEKPKQESEKEEKGEEGKPSSSPSEREEGKPSSSPSDKKEAENEKKE